MKISWLTKVSKILQILIISLLVFLSQVNIQEIFPNSCIQYCTLPSPVYMYCINEWSQSRSMFCIISEQGCYGVWCSEHNRLCNVPVVHELYKEWQATGQCRSAEKSQQEQVGLNRAMSADKVYHTDFQYTRSNCCAAIVMSISSVYMSLQYSVSKVSRSQTNFVQDEKLPAVNTSTCE